MSTTFQNRQLSFLIQCLVFTGILFSIHLYIVSYFFSKTPFLFPLWHLHLFNFATTILVYTAINYKYSKDKTSVFNTFMIATLVKMGLVIVFLLPLILGELKDKKPDVFNFFIVYFLFLAFEVYSITKFLKNDV